MICEMCGERTTEQYVNHAFQCPDCGMYVGAEAGAVPVFSVVEKIVVGALLLVSTGTVAFVWAWGTFEHLGGLRWP